MPPSGYVQNQTERKKESHPETYSRIYPRERNVAIDYF